MKIINDILDKTLYKYRTEKWKCLSKSEMLICSGYVTTASDLLNYENICKEIDPCYNCYNGQLIYVRDENQIYMLKNYKNTKSIISWEKFENNDMN